MSHFVEGVDLEKVIAPVSKNVNHVLIFYAMGVTGEQFAPFDACELTFYHTVQRTKTISIAEVTTAIYPAVECA